MRRHVPVIAVLGIAAGLRLWGIDFGLPHTVTRPDEEAAVSIGLQLFKRQWNPGFFDWPSLFLYVVGAGYAIYFNIGRLVGWFPYEVTFLREASRHPAPLYRIARGLSVTSGVLTVWTIYRIGERLFDRTTALIGAFFLAVAALHVRDSHFGVTDVAATSLLCLSFLFTVRYARQGGRRDAWSSAILAGLAASTKYNAGLIALPGLWAIAAGGGTKVDRGRLMIVYVALTAVAFCAGTPYALIDSPSFLSALASVSAHLRGGHAAFAGTGWSVHLTSSLRHGLGWPLLLAGMAGVALLLLRERRSGLIFALFPVTYFAIIGAGQTAFARYIIPIVPFLCLSAAYLTVQSARALALRNPRVSAPAMAWLLAALLAAPSAWTAARTDYLLAQTDSRLIAAEWIRASFPDRTTMYQTGSGYGHVQVATADPRAATGYPEVAFDERAGFLDKDGRAAASPDLIIVQECPLPYCDVPAGLRQILTTGYERQRTFTALDAKNESLAYDRDDAFFVPLAGFGAVQRPGPNLIVYARRR
jgi:Dolichyl-phosphate-mannose-protein mannosyltransferase